MLAPSSAGATFRRLLSLEKNNIILATQEAIIPAGHAMAVG
jgi:hypothetical protein